jgi:uncharacterized protein YyaL (SSP411 family)
LGQARSAQRHRPRVSADEARLVARIIELARENGYVESFSGKLRDELLDGHNGPVCSDPTVYVCENRFCKLPTNEIEETKTVLDAKSAVS